MKQGWKKTVNGQTYIVFEDIYADEIHYLNLVLEAGPIASDCHRQSADHVLLRRLARAYELADRFLIKCVLSELKIRAELHIGGDANSIHNWRLKYHEEVDSLRVGDPQRERNKLSHEKKLVDYAEMYEIICMLPVHAQVVRVGRILNCIVNHTPRILVNRMTRSSSEAANDNSRIKVNRAFYDFIASNMILSKNT